MPAAEFDGEIVVVDNESQIPDAVETLRKCRLTGFDTETRPSFRRGEHHKMALMQIATPEVCYLFRICKIGLPAELREYIEDASCAKVGLSLNDDFGQLRATAECHPAGFIDIQAMVKEYEIAELSLRKIYAILFGRKISKTQRLTNWEADTLTPGQQHYAAVDAWACIDIYDFLQGGRFDAATSPYYHEIETT